MVANDYYRMNAEDVRGVIDMCEQASVYSIAIQGYEWLLHTGKANRNEYSRLASLYNQRGDLFNMHRVLARERAIYQNNE